MEKVIDIIDGLIKLIILVVGVGFIAAMLYTAFTLTPMEMGALRLADALGGTFAYMKLLFNMTYDTIITWISMLF